MIPRDRHGDQVLQQHDLAVRGTEGDHRISWERDQFGNRVARVVANRVPQAVDFEATFRLTRGSRAGVSEPPWRNDAERLEYLRPTALTAPDKRLLDAAVAIARASTDARERAERASAWTATAIAYQFGVTGYSTPAAMALHLGKGVCQDYAHIAIAVLRTLGVPARYVSGHVLGEGAPHAWFEALLPDPLEPTRLIARAYDPTHHRRPGMSYITVAVGRDYADVAPTSGSFTGMAGSRLVPSKDAWLVDLQRAAQ